MYCMPKVGTRAMLYLQDSDAGSAIAINSPRENGQSCGAMADANMRCFTTEHGKKLFMFPDSMGLRCGTPDATVQIMLDEKSGLLMESAQAVQMIARQGIVISAPTVGASAPQQLLIQQSSAATENEALIVAKGTADKTNKNSYNVEVGEKYSIEDTTFDTIRITDNNQDGTKLVKRGVTFAPLRDLLSAYGVSDLNLESDGKYHAYIYNTHGNANNGKALEFVFNDRNGDLIILDGSGKTLAELSRKSQLEHDNKRPLKGGKNDSVIQGIGKTVKYEGANYVDLSYFVGLMSKLGFQNKELEPAAKISNISLTVNGWMNLYDAPTVDCDGRTVEIPQEAIDKYSEYSTGWWFMSEFIYDLNNNAVREVINTGENVTVIGAHNEMTDKDGRYWVAVGPNVMNPNHKPGEEITVDEMQYGTRIDVVLKDGDGNIYYLPVVVGETKAHTYPNGIYQTGYPFPNGTPPSTSNNDWSIIEFVSKASIAKLGNFDIVKLIVYD